MILCCFFFSNSALAQGSAEEVFYLDRKAEQNHRWFDMPTVYVCKNSKITESRVRKAISMWRRLGYDIRGPIMRSEIPECIVYDSSYGKIIIGSNTGRVPVENAAITRTWYSWIISWIIRTR